MNIFNVKAGFEKREYLVGCQALSEKGS